ncbi:MAG: hypothetical protein ACTSUW_05990 [Candidatus Heimdallarchaeota archaeon]
MSYLDILAYISVGIITFSWILVLIFDIGKKVIDKKADIPIIEENSESEII